MKRTIAVAGNMGAGKSTMVEFLNRTYGISPFYEPAEDNPYLPDFYRDMGRWSFHSQLYFLSNKFRIHQELDRMPGVVALDRTIFEDAEVFATALHDMKMIDKRDWQIYRGFYLSILDAIRPPDLMIYLRCSMRTLRQRIALRGRSMERDVPISYLRRLDRLYEKWIDAYDMGDVLILETDSLDYVNDLIHRLDVMERIEAVLPPEFGKPGVCWWRQSSSDPVRGVSRDRALVVRILQDTRSAARIGVVMTESKRPEAGSSTGKSVNGSSGFRTPRTACRRRLL